MIKLKNLIIASILSFAVGGIIGGRIMKEFYKPRLVVLVGKDVTVNDHLGNTYWMEQDSLDAVYGADMWYLKEK